MGTIWRVLTRKKVLDPVSTEESQLGRVLNTVDLTALGVGSTLGVGVYVLVGHVAKDMAGPAVILSFLIATVASVFAGLCYAEFGARAPRAGSAYIYSYVCVGEFIAFIIGWNLILEYVIGSASVARGLSLYLDTLINNTLKNAFIDIAPISNAPFMSAYFDFFAFGVSVLLAIALAFGLKESTWVNNIFTLLNLVVVAFVVIAGGIKADPHNWDLDARNITGAGSGGFFPFGVEGMIKGAATCFYGFVGFDCIATTGEEVKNPKKAIPLSIIVSLFIIFLAYFGTSTVVTLMVPYFDQDPDAPLPHAFATVGMDWAKWVVAIGGIFGLCASLFGAMFPLPRIIYAMASDSIIFQFLGRVSSRFKTPVVGTLLAGLFTGLMAALFELKQLVNMMSIGTLMAYTIVAASVLLLRYSETEAVESGGTTEETDLVPAEFTCANIWRQIFNCGRQQSPSEVSERIVKVEVFVYCILCILIGLCVRFLNEPIGKGEIWAIVLIAIVVALAILVVMSITTQPKSRKELSFKVPLVPLIPALSILTNIYLMLMLDPNTWIRFAIWMIIGIPTYYFSVKTHPDARNESIYSRGPSIDGKLNGFTNHNFINEEEDIQSEPRKKPAPPPPTLKNIEATIAVLDQMLENEEANIENNDRKYSADSLSTASNVVLREENVQADVHCSDIPLTPTNDNPLLQSDDLIYHNPDTFPTEVTDLSSEDADFTEPNNFYVEKVNDSDVTENKLVSEKVIEIDKSSNEDINPDESEYIEIPPSPEKGKPIPFDLATPPPLHNPEIPSPEKDKPVPFDLAIPHNPEIPSPEKDKPIPFDLAIPPPLHQPDESDFIDIQSPEKDKVVLLDVAIPPPPPPLLMELQTGDFPRLQVHANNLLEVKLRPVQGRKPPSENSVIPPTNENLKFGSPEYKEFREQLDNKLLQGYVLPPQVPIEVKVKPQKENVHVTNEDVIEDSIDRNVAKEKLVQFLERTNSLPYFPPKNVNRSRFNNSEREETTPVNLSEHKEKHRQNMENIFRSVRLRKESSFKQPQNDDVKDDVDVPKSEDPHEEIVTLSPSNEKQNNDRLRHEENMNGIFKSIRLRKIDSLKSNESQ